jgi:hypothetical protein
MEKTAYHYIDGLKQGSIQIKTYGRETAIVNINGYVHNLRFSSIEPEVAAYIHGMQDALLRY